MSDITPEVLRREAKWAEEAACHGWARSFHDAANALERMRSGPNGMEAMANTVKRCWEALEPMQPEDNGQYLWDVIARRCADALRWQPIETAPKDGHYVIITDGKVLVDVALWMHEQPARGAYLARPAGWFNVTRSRMHEPTHWMPLPEQPRARASEAGARP